MKKKEEEEISIIKIQICAFFGRNVITTFPSYYIHNKMLSKESSCRWPGRHYYQGGATHHAQWARIFFKSAKKNSWKNLDFTNFFFGTRFITNFKGNKNLRHISFGWILVKMSIDFLFYFMFLLLPFLLAFTSPLCTHTQSTLEKSFCPPQ